MRNCKFCCGAAIRLHRHIAIGLSVLFTYVFFFAYEKGEPARRCTHEWADELKVDSRRRRRSRSGLSFMNYLS